MCELARANNIKVILCSVLPVIKFPWNLEINPIEKIIDLNKLIRNYTCINNIALINYYEKMVDESRGLKKEYTYDGVHPNKLGYKIMEPIAKKSINKVLKTK